MVDLVLPESIDDALAYVEGLDDSALEGLMDMVLDNVPIWTPQAGPQHDAYYCKADELFYGGQAGGGKTELIIGLATTAHEHSIVFRREATQMHGIYKRMEEILGSRDGFNGSTKIWVPKLLDGKVIEFGSTPHLGDETNYQGRPHDLIGFDEISNFLEAQFRFLKGWLRSAKGLRTRVVCAGNPPTTSDGLWVKDYWGPWLDPRSKVKAHPGELLWYTTGDDGKDMLCDGPDPVKVKGEMVKPKSRTFIPSSVEDNAFLLRSGYRDQLAALPEPLRSQMMQGDFAAGEGDDPWQVIPAKWVDLAMERWEARPEGAKGTMTELGCDVARGGMDSTVLAPRYDRWFDELKKFPGAETPDGPIVAGLVVANVRHSAPAMVDVIGVGTSVVDHLALFDIPHVGVNNARMPTAEERKTDDWKITAGEDGPAKLGFFNTRARCYWRLREALDPAGPNPIAIPPSKELRADLVMPKWSLVAQGIKVESKDDIKKRLGRSPDDGDSVALTFEKHDKTKKHRKAVGPKTLKLPNHGMM